MDRASGEEIFWWPRSLETGKPHRLGIPRVLINQLGGACWGNLDSG
jgi:hypothetical protein